MTEKAKSFAEPFRSRYAVEVIDESGEGVLVDLSSGSFFQLNATAAAVCRALAECDTTEAAVARTIQEQGLIPSAAKDAVDAVLTNLDVTPPRDEAPEPIVYRFEGDGIYALDENERRVFTIDSRRKTVRVFGHYSDEATLAEYVRAIVPKLLALLEKPILHASSCRIGSSFVAICGKSGAGKTTTARAFQAAGARLVSEDLLILASEAAAPSAYLEGEAAARAWCRASARHFLADPEAELSYDPLAEIEGGPTLPLDTLWFVDAERRRGVELILRPVSKTTAATFLLGNGFLAASEAATWRKFIKRCSDLTRRLPVYEATTPAGLEALAEAARGYTVNSAS